MSVFKSDHSNVGMLEANSSGKISGDSTKEYMSAYSSISRKMHDEDKWFDEESADMKNDSMSDHSGRTYKTARIDCETDLSDTEDDSSSTAASSSCSCHKKKDNQAKSKALPVLADALESLRSVCRGTNTSLDESRVETPKSVSDSFGSQLSSYIFTYTKDNHTTEDKCKEISAAIVENLSQSINSPIILNINICNVHCSPTTVERMLKNDEATIIDTVTKIEKHSKFEHEQTIKAINNILKSQDTMDNTEYQHTKSNSESNSNTVREMDKVLKSNSCTTEHKSSPRTSGGQNTNKVVKNVMYELSDSTERINIVLEDSISTLETTQLRTDLRELCNNSIDSVQTDSDDEPSTRIFDQRKSIKVNRIYYNPAFTMESSESQIGLESSDSSTDLDIFCGSYHNELSEAVRCKVYHVNKNGFNENELDKYYLHLNSALELISVELETKVIQTSPGFTKEVQDFTEYFLLAHQNADKIRKHMGGLRFRRFILQRLETEIIGILK